MKVLFISNLEIEPWGGSEELWCHLANKMLDNGIEVAIDRIEWKTKPVKLQHLIDRGATIYPRPNNHIYHKPTEIGFRIRNWFYQRDIAKSIRLYKPDYIVVSLSGTFDGLLSRYTSELINSHIPYILLSQHGFENVNLRDREREIFRKAFLNARQVYFVSQRNREVAEKALCVSLKNSTLVYSPAVIDRTFNEAFPATGIVKMACAARLDIPYKGQDILLDVLKANKWKSRSWELSIYGTGPYENYIKELIRFYGLESKVFLRGFSKKVEDIWKENQILILPSHSEGTPISLLQACYCSRPAVVTNVGGNAEVVLDGITGFVADSPTAISIDTAMERAFENCNKWKEMGEAARTRAETLITAKDYNCINEFLMNELSK